MFSFTRPTVRRTIGGVLFFALTVWTLAAVFPALALSLGGVGIRPAHPRPPDTGWFIYQLKPGESTTDAVLVSNETDTEQALDLAAVDYEPTDIGAFGLKGSSAEQTSIGLWTQLSTTTITLPPGKAREVEFTLTIPQNADVGEHAGAIVVQPSQRARSSAVSGAYITTRVGARIYNTVPGELVRKIKLLGFLMHEDKKTQHYEFVVQGKNEGNVSVSPRLRLHLNGWGLVKVPPVGDAELADFPGFALFGFQRFLPKELSNNWQLARGATVETYFRWRKPWLGRFSAYLTLEYERKAGEPEVIRSETFKFTVLPWPATGYFLGVLAFLAALIITWIAWRRIKFSGRGWQKYTVKAGDTLTVVAARCRLSWKHLAKVNKLKKPYVISAGDSILVPPGTKLATEKPGEKPAVKEDSPAMAEKTPAVKRRRVPRWVTLTAIGVVSALLVALAGFLLFRSMVQPPEGNPPLTPTPQESPKENLPSAQSATSTPSVPAAATTTPAVGAPAKDAMIVSVLNGSGIAGLAGAVVDELRAAGYRELSAGNADAFSYEGATIRYRPGLRGAAEDVQTVLRVRYEKFTLEEKAMATTTDVVIILGKPVTP